MIDIKPYLIVLIGGRQVMAVRLFAAKTDRILPLEYGNRRVVVKEAVLFTVPLHPYTEVRITGNRFLNRMAEHLTVYRAIHPETESNDIGKVFPSPVQKIGFQKILLHCLPPFR